jgi:capsular polysaccharide biosynthesis protein
MVNRPAEEIAAKLVNVFAAPESGTSVVRLSVDAIDPVFAADFANAWAASVLDFAAEQKATYRVLDRATPAYAPVQARRLESIWRAAFVGLAIGILLASVPAALSLRRAPGA